MTWFLLGILFTLAAGAVLWWKFFRK